MNKFHLILSGSVVGALAAGGTAGYLFAKKEFAKKVEGLIEAEVAATRRYYSLQIMQLKQGKPATPGEMLAQKTAEHDEAEVEEEPSDEDVLAAEDAKKAATNYRGYSRPDGEQGDSVKHNIFSDSTPPPRNLTRSQERDANGKFLPKTPLKLVENSQADEPPELIDEDTFLADDDCEEENLKYFPEEKELLDYARESVDIERVGEVNLTLFPDVEEGTPSVIFVRNHGLQIKYEILRMEVPLTEFMGFSGGEIEEGDLHYT